MSTFGAGAAGLAASTFSPFNPQAEQAPSGIGTGSIDQLKAADTRSIRSATTSASQGVTRHPDLTDIGLNTSIIETITARFEKGQVVNSSLIGEVALAYNTADSSSTPNTETIRLENFTSLEKVAPNPAFIQPIPDKSGEYTVNVSNIARTQIAFKYQIRLDDDGASLAPLLITPALKIEPTQCSVIVSYSLNPAFPLNGQESITLSNVLLALTIEGTRANSCQSRPVGTFAREKNLIFWQLNDVKLVPGAAPEKLLARFATESEAGGASVEGKWELVGDAVGSALSVSSMQGGATESSDPFADESAHNAAVWKPVSGPRKLVSGSYVAK